MNKLILILLALTFVPFGSVSAKEYLLDWYLKGTMYERILFDDKSSFNLVKGEGPWEDNKGYFGYLNCIGNTSDIDNKSNSNSSGNGSSDSNSNINDNLKVKYNKEIII